MSKYFKVTAIAVTIFSLYACSPKPAVYKEYNVTKGSITTTVLIPMKQNILKSQCVADMLFIDYKDPE